MHSYPLFLRTKELKDVLGLPESRALALLEEHGIKPVDMGRGRCNGLRWRTSAVIHLADTLHAEAQSTERQRRKKAASHPIRGRNAAELYAEFNREQRLQ